MTPKVQACITSRDGHVHFRTLQAVDAACSYAMSMGIAEAQGLVCQNPYGVAHCRNQAVADLLSSDATHLLFVDDDVLVPENVLEKLLAAGMPIVSGCCPCVSIVNDSVNGSAYINARFDGKWADGWFDGLQSAEAVGAGCILIGREVLEEIGFPWFTWGEHQRGNRVYFTSDDVQFCNRASELGYKIFAHGNVRCRHFKVLDVGELLERD